MNPKTPAATLLFTLLFSPNLAAAKKHKKKPPPPVGKRLLEKAAGPITLRLDSVDLAEGRVVAILTGVTRAVDARLFTFHDDADRHFIALDSRCEAVAAPAAEREDKAKRTAEPERAIRCVLAYPAPYAFAHVRAFTVRLGQREVHAPDAEVGRLFAAAQASAKAPAPSPAGASPHAARLGPDAGARPAGPDGGVADPEDDDSDGEGDD